MTPEIKRIIGKTHKEIEADLAEFYRRYPPRSIEDSLQPLWPVLVIVLVLWGIIGLGLWFWLF